MCSSDLWLHKAADAYGEKVNELDNAWIKNGEDAIKASAKEWYVPSEAEMTKWRAGHFSPYASLSLNDLQRASFF